MKTIWSTLVVPGLLLTGICVTPTTALAELKIFTIDSIQSSLTLSGSLPVLGVAIQEQQPGSLTAHYKGTIMADVTDTAITFVGGSLIAAVTNGVWSPNTNGVAGTGPANYGGSLNAGIATGTAAFRELIYDATSGALPVTAGSFPAVGMTFSFPPGVTSALDYLYSGFVNGHGRKILTGNSTNNIVSSGSLSNQAGNLVLTIPVDFTGSSTLGSAGALQYRLQGQFVAVATAPLKISAFQFNAGQLNFTISTISNQSYSILGSTNLPDWSSTNDQFTATNTTTTRSIPLPAVPREFFRVRQN